MSELFGFQSLEENEFIISVPSFPQPANLHPGGEVALGPLPGIELTKEIYEIPHPPAATWGRSSDSIHARQLAALTAQRDAASEDARVKGDRASKAEAQVEQLKDERDTWSSVARGWQERAYMTESLVEALQDALASVIALEVEIMGLHDALAKRPAAFTDPDEKPEHNPFREFPGDRRMMGR
jgi:hypothetical protein